MANIQSGQVYNINIGSKTFYATHDSSATVAEYYQWLVQQIATTLNIDVSYFNLKWNSAGKGFFNLPYINSPKVNEQLVFYIENIYMNSNSDPTTVSAAGTYLTYITAKNLSDASSLENVQYPIAIEAGCVTKEYNNLRLSQWMPGTNEFDLSSSSLEDTNLQFNTKFLNNYEFYNIGMVKYNNTEDSNIFYYAPYIFICSMVNMLDNTKSDAAFALRQCGYTNILKNGNITQQKINDNSISEDSLYDYNYGIAALGLINDGENKHYNIQGFKPYYFASNNEKNFSIMKLCFGELKANKGIYLLNIKNSSILKNYCEFNVNQVSTYESGWKKDAFVDSDLNKFTIGLAETKGNPDGTEIEFIPVLGNIDSELKLVPWPTGIDEDVTDMINNFYDGNLSLSEIQTQWFVNDKRVLSDWMEMATNIEGSGNKQTKMTITEFVDNDSNNEVILYY